MHFSGSIQSKPRPVVNLIVPPMRSKGHLIFVSLFHAAHKFSKDSWTMCVGATEKEYKTETKTIE